ncbi:MAG: long-chain-acyl-CoA synthetase [Deltaproteobacteria bacterium]|nr:long-chain-acyl-CoA synthetase [Deltaproteobacteria bacterium]
MDLLSRLFTWIEDRIERPRLLAIREALSSDPGALRTMGFVCREHAERIPDAIALRFEKEEISFGSYNEGVNRYANLLRSRDVRKGSVVNIMMENSPDFLMAQGACAKLGAVGALINHHLEGEALVHVHRCSGAEIALVDVANTQSLRPLSAELSAIEIHGDARNRRGEDLRFRPLREELAEASTNEPEIPDVSLGDVFLFVYTSGTTGLPKPAVVRHLRFTAGGRSLAMLLEETPDDCVYAPIPLYHGWANFVGFAPAFYTGACFASRRKFSASEFLSDARRHEVTIFAFVGELCRYLMRTPPTAADREHGIRLATGAGMRPDIWRDFQRRFGIPKIMDSYGQTEGNVSLQNRRGRVGSVGRSAPNTHDQLRLARYDSEAGELVRGPDGMLVECRVGEPGELLSRISKSSPMPFDGYANPADNEKKMLRDCFEKGDVYLRTGDLLKRDRASYYYFVDRIGDTFRWKGENVATLELEHLLNTAPGVSETAVYGVRVPGADGRAGMALVVPVDAASFDPQAFLAHAEKNLPGYARPLFIRVADYMDVTGNFKHRKLRLQAEGFDPSRIEDPLFFRDDEAGSFIPIDQSLHAEIMAGLHRL